MASETNRISKQRVVSGVLNDGRLFETVYHPQERKTLFAVSERSGVRLLEDISDNSATLVPISPANNLIKHHAVLFAEAPEEYDSVPKLVSDIEAYIYQYVDISDHFRKIASYYILLTWVYDAFNELPYLRLRGDFGSGKTRALTVLGSVCNKPFFASGASSVSPIFHTLDTFGGTLVIDEADFRFSDEKNELVKVFNNGNVRGFPVLRTSITPKGEYNPQAFNVYGPKIIAMRKAFDDPALESRFLTEEMGQRALRRDIPINLPDAQKAEALALRNRLLMYRFRMLGSIRVNDSLVDPLLSPRLNQILIPLLSIIEDEPLRQDIRAAMRGFDQKLYAERSGSMEAMTLAVLLEHFETNQRPAQLSQITQTFNTRHASDFERYVSVREVGGIIRKRLRLFTYKSHGVFVVPTTESSKVRELCLRYGVLERREA